MHGFVTSEAMDERHKDTVQDGVLFVERLARALRFAAGKQASPGADRRAGGLTAHGARRNFDRGIVADAL